MDYFKERRNPIECFHWMLQVLALGVLLGIPLVLTGCFSRYIGTSEPFSESDLVGVWHADYENIWAYDSRIAQVVDVTGAETLTLQSDGTYLQVYDDAQGNIKTVDGNRWYMDEANIIHLEGGMWPQLGPEDSAFFAEKKLYGIQSVRGKDLRLEAGEAYLVVTPLGSGRFELSHLGTGDPDSPNTVRFRRIQD